MTPKAYIKILEKRIKSREKAKMNKQQKEVLATLTCGILDRYDNIEEHLKSHGIPKSLVKKMSKAMDLIFEVNQSCFAKKNNGA